MTNHLDELVEQIRTIEDRHRAAAERERQVEATVLGLKHDATVSQTGAWPSSASSHPSTAASSPSAPPSNQ